MAGGTVPTANLTAFYDNTTGGVTASPTLIDAAIQDIVTTINANWNALIATTAGDSGAHNVRVATIVGLAAANVWAALNEMEAQVQAIQGGTVPSGSITAAMIQDLAVTAAKIALGTITNAQIAADTLTYGNHDTNAKTALDGGQIYTYKNAGGAL